MIWLQETMTGLDGNKIVTLHNIADTWSEARQLLSGIFQELTNEQFSDLKNGRGLQFKTGPLHREICLYEKSELVS